MFVYVYEGHRNKGIQRLNFFIWFDLLTLASKMFSSDKDVGNCTVGKLEYLSGW